MSMLEQIQNKLKNAFNIQYLEVFNESHMHSRGSESHFKVILVTHEFEGKRLLQRHRAINTVLSDELSNHIHALSLHTYTPSEWQQQTAAPDSPKCMGGSGFDK